MTRRQALLIGVAKYRSAAIDDLSIVCRDLTVLRDSLESSGFAIEVVGGENDESPGRTLILQRLRQACREAKGTDVLLLYFSGHGIHYGGRDYLIPADADISDPDYLTDYLVSTELGSVIDQCPAQTILLVIDACREGVKLEAKAIGLSQWGRGDRQKATKRSLFLIFACGPGQHSQYVSGEEGFSLFTRAFAEVLQPQHPAYQIDTVLKATQVRLNELVVKHQKSPQEIRVAYESTAEDDQRSRIICEGQLQKSENSLAPFVQKTPVGMPFQVPPLPSYYVDRPDARNRLKCALLSENENMPGTLVVSAIYGLGGIGKSVLATALALDPEVQAKFSDGVLWATLGQQPEILAFLDNWIQALRDFDYKPTTIESASTHLRSLLHDKRLLLVVDDAWTAEAVEPFRVGGSNCRVLVTTREARVPGAERVDLEQMEPDEAISLLERYLRKTLTVTERLSALQFAAAVGYLPLALELAAAQVQDGLDWTALLMAFEEEVARLEVLDAPDLVETISEKVKKQRSLKASFNLSLQRLNAELEQRFVKMGVLPEDVNVGAAAMATIWDVSLEGARWTLRELRRRSLLLDGLAREGEPNYRMHDLMHDIARSRLQDSVGLVEAHRQVCDCYRIDAGQWWRVPNDGYIHQRLTWHLQMAGLEEEIHALLMMRDEQGRNAWFEVCDRVGQPTIFVQDVARGWKVAEQMYEENKTLSIVLQCRYALIKSTLNSLVENLSTDLIIALIRKKFWTVEQAWAYVEQVQDEEGIRKTIRAIAPYLPPSLMSSAITKTLQMRHETRRVSVFIELAKNNYEAFSRFLSAIQSIQNEFDREFLFKQLDKIKLKQSKDSMQAESDWDKILVYLANINSKNLLEALAIVSSIQTASKKAEALSILAKTDGVDPVALLEAIMSVKGGLASQIFLSDALDNITRINGKSFLAFLKAKASVKRESGWDEIFSDFEEAGNEDFHRLLSIARNIPVPSRRVKAISALAYMDNSDRSALIDAVRAVQDEYEHVTALCNLAKIDKTYLTEASTVAYAVNDRNRRAILLRDLARLDKLFLPNALATASAIQDDYLRTTVLLSLAEIDIVDVYQLLESALSVTNSLKRLIVMNELNQINKTIIPELFDKFQGVQDQSTRLSLRHIVEELNLSSSCFVIKMPTSVIALENNDTKTDEQSLRLGEIEFASELMQIRTIKNESERSRLLSNLLNKPLSEDQLSKVEEAIFEVTYVLAAEVFSKYCSHIPLATLSYSNWQKYLHIFAHRTRKYLMKDLVTLYPAIEQLGGEEAIKGMVNAMNEVCHQWS